VPVLRGLFGTSWKQKEQSIQFRTLLQIDQQLPSLSSQTNPKANADGTVDVYWSPTRPANGAIWIQTIR
jgi:hypothetical protein